MSFWTRNLGTPGAVRPVSRPPLPAETAALPQQQAAIQQQQLPGYLSHGYALDTASPGVADPIASRILDEGYIRKPPEWVDHQPNERCPSCDSPNYVQCGANAYGTDTILYSKDGPAKTISFKRCWNCNYAGGKGRMNALSGLVSNGTVDGGAPQTNVGGASKSNLGYSPDGNTFVIESR